MWSLSTTLITGYYKAFFFWHHFKGMSPGCHSAAFRNSAFSASNAFTHSMGTRCAFPLIVHTAESAGMISSPQILHLHSLILRLLSASLVLAIGGRIHRAATRPYNSARLLATPGGRGLSATGGWNANLQSHRLAQ